MHHGHNGRDHMYSRKMVMEQDGFGTLVHEALRHHHQLPDHAIIHANIITIIITISIISITISISASININTTKIRHP